jgi:hypothetical protein
MKSLSLYRQFVVFVIASVLLDVAAAANLTSRVNRNQVGTNETLTLTVSIDRQVESSELDLRPLQEKFEILDATPQSRSSFNIVNGRSQQAASTTWSITLVAKSEGILTIPAFTIGADSSKPISIKVSNSTASNNSASPLSASVSINTKEVYPNQQFIVEIELSAANNVGDLNGAQLVIAGAEVEPFDQQNFQRLDNGVARQIVILKYSVFAKQAGELTIPIMTYTGVKNGQRNVFRNTGTQVIARSKPINIEVKKIPETNNRQWFPAQNVTISAKLSGNGSTLKVGEPITRTITISAKGQQASVIPPLKYDYVDANLKLYKDQPQLETKKTNQGFIATRIESEALVANQAGEYLLPAISIDWWNVKTKQWQTSTVKPQMLSVTGTSLPVDSRLEPIATVTETPTTTIINDSKSTLLWQIVSAVLALIIALQFYFLRKAVKPEPEPDTTQQYEISEKEVWSALQAAFKADNSQAIRSGLLLWGRQALGSEQPISLDQLQQYAAKLDVSEELKNQFNVLDTHLYRNGKKPDFSAIAQLVGQLKIALIASSKSSRKSKPELKPLYPN